jgi:hypothetical protein
MPHIDAGRDVGSLVTTTSIQSVTSGAVGVEGVPSGYVRRLAIVAPEIMFLREQVGGVKGPSAKQEAESEQSGGTRA